jgi:hypothetical protein
MKAKTCIGGKASRKVLDIPVNEPQPEKDAELDKAIASEADVVSQLSSRPRKLSTSLQWCSVCHNGGSLVACECGRTLCSDCAPQLDDVPKELLAEASFKCAYCERGSRRESSCYMVRIL